MTTRILIASAQLPPTAGGAERVAWELAKRLAKESEVHVLTTQKDPHATRNVRVHYVRRVPLMTIFCSSIGHQMIESILAQTGPDIVHCHMPLPWGYVLRRTESKKVITCHGSDVFPKKRLPVGFF